MNFINQKTKKATGSKPCANIRYELEDKKLSKTFFEVLEKAKYAKSNNI